MSWSQWFRNELDPSVNPGPKEFLGSPSAVARGDAVHLFARSPSDRLLEYRWSRERGITWWQAHDDGFRISSSPSTASRNPDHLVVAARSSDGTLGVKEFTTRGGWSAWQIIDPSQQIVGAPAVISRNNDVINVYARSATGALLQVFWQQGTNWNSGWRAHTDGGLRARV